MSNRLPSLLMLLALFMPMMVAAAAEPGDRSHPCAAVAEPSERLACYDEVFPPILGARSDLVDLEARRKKAVEDFGLDQAQLAEREPERYREIKPDQVELTVARVTERSNGERVVTMGNGQVWLLTEATSRGRLRSGDSVVIRDAALGTYMLVTPGGVPLRARRLQ